MSEHTKEPWAVGIGPTIVALWNEKSSTWGRHIARLSWWGYCLSTYQRESKANARRIVAAVNACAGIPTDALEAGAVRRLVGAVEGFKELLGPEGKYSICRADHKPMGFYESSSVDAVFVKATTALAAIKGKGEACSCWDSDNGKTHIVCSRCLNELKGRQPK